MTRHLSEDVRREQILDAARTAFVEAGYTPTRMEDIAKRAGLSKGGIYFHFASKQELFEALVEQEFALAVRRLEAVGQSEGTTQEKLLTLGQFYIGRVENDPRTARFFLVMSSEALRDPTLRQRLQQMHDTYVGALESLIQAGVRQGELEPVHARTVAVLLKTLLNGLENAIAMEYEQQLNALLPTMLQLLLNGLVVRSPNSTSTPAA